MKPINPLNSWKSVYTNMNKTGHIDFKYQLGRDQVRSTESVFSLMGAHEARFAYSPIPCKILGNYHSPSSPDFKKIKARDNSMYKKNMTPSEYHPSQPAYLGTLKKGCIFLISCKKK